MGIFKDLGFKNRNGEVEVPNAETIAGLTIEEFKNSFLPPKIVNDADGLIQIQGSALPKTITQEAGQSNWVKYQASVKHNITSFNKTIYSNQSGAGDRFGGSCAIGSTFMLIGSQLDDDKGSDAGKVEMFDLNGNFIKTIYSNQPAANDWFGVSCAIGSTFMLIGSHHDTDKGSAAGKVEMFAIDTTKPTLTINNVVQTEESSSLSEIVYKPQMVNTNTLTISSTGSIESVDINTYILE